MNPSNVNSDPRNCSNLLTTPPYAPTINYNLLLSQKKSARNRFFQRPASRLLKKSVCMAI
jgi:hypothetical protein